MKNYSKPVLAIGLMGTIISLYGGIAGAISVKKSGPGGGSGLGGAFYRKLTNEFKDVSIYQSNKELTSAIRLINASKFDAAIDKMERFLQKKPGSALAREILGVALIMKGDTAKGIKFLKKAVQLNPRLVTAIVKVGFVHLTAKEYRKAKIEFEKALEIDPKNIKAHQWLGIIYEKEGKFKTAVNHYEKGLVGVPARSVGIKVNLARLYNLFAKFEKSTSLLGNIIGKKSKNTGGHIVLGGAYLGLKKTDRAIEEFEIARTLEPKNEKVHLSLGIAHRAKEDYPQSLAEFRQVISIKPKWSTGYFQMAETLVRMKKPAPALKNYRIAAEFSKNPYLIKKVIGDLFLSQEQFSKAIELYKEMINSKEATPKTYDLLVRAYQLNSQMDYAEKTLKEMTLKYSKNPYVFSRLGLFYASHKKYNQAIAQYKKGLSISPDDPGILRVLSATYHKMGDLYHAIETARRITIINPENIPDKFYLATLYHDAHNNTEAINTYRQIISVRPDYVLALNNLATFLSEEEGGLDEALALARKAASIAPKSGEIADTLGWILFKQKKNKESLEVLQKSASLTPDHPTINFHLGMAYYKDDQSGEALDRFSRAIKLSTTFPEYKEALKMKEMLAGGPD